MRTWTPAAYPRVLASRAGSPLLFGLAPRGVCRASDVATGAVGSYPTVSPLPSIFAFNSPLARAIFKTH